MGQNMNKFKLYEYFSEVMYPIRYFHELEVRLWSNSSSEGQ